MFLPGWEEALFPHQRALDESGAAGLEEERRLAYVGLTRARRRAVISYAANRRVHNMWQSSLPSRFVGELPREHCEKASEMGDFAAEMSTGLTRLSESEAGSFASSRGGWMPLPS